MRRTPTLTVVTVVLLVTTACTTGCTGGTPANAGSYLTDLSGTTVEVAATWSGAEAENFRAVLDEFARRTNVRVK